MNDIAPQVITIDSTSIIMCDICEKTFTTRYSLILHKKRKVPCISPDMAAYRNQCDICKEIFTDRNNLNSHKKRKTPCIAPSATIQGYQCDRCKEIFETTTSLRNHQKRIIPCISPDMAIDPIRDAAIIEERKRRTCELCNQEFSRIQYLAEHHNLGYSCIATSFSCELCHKTFNSYHQMTRHQTLGCVSPIFECDVCKEVFKRKTHLERHKNRIIPCTSPDIVIVKDPFMCVFCDRELKTKKILKNHMKICPAQHSPEYVLSLDLRSRIRELKPLIGVNCLYFIEIEPEFYKYGISTEIDVRLDRHRRVLKFTHIIEIFNCGDKSAMVKLEGVIDSLAEIRSERVKKYDSNEIIHTTNINWYLNTVLQIIDRTNCIQL